MIYLFNTYESKNIIINTYKNFADYAQSDENNYNKRDNVYIKRMLDIYGGYSFIGGIIIVFNHPQLKKNISDYNTLLNIKRIFDIKELLI